MSSSGSLKVVAPEDTPCPARNQYTRERSARVGQPWTVTKRYKSTLLVLHLFRARVLADGVPRAMLVAVEFAERVLQRADEFGRCAADRFVHRFALVTDRDRRVTVQ